MLVIPHLHLHLQIPLNEDVVIEPVAQGDPAFPEFLCLPPVSANFLPRRFRLLEPSLHSPSLGSRSTPQ